MDIPLGFIGVYIPLGFIGVNMRSHLHTAIRRLQLLGAVSDVVGLPLCARKSSLHTTVFIGHGFHVCNTHVLRQGVNGSAQGCTFSPFWGL